MADYDLIAVGGGAGGLAAVRAVAAAGKRALLISDSPIGGDCTWTGCVPSKTLIGAAAQGLPFGEAMERVHRIRTEIGATEDAAALAGEGIDVIAGRATLTTGRAVDVDGRRIAADAIVLATGGRAAVPPIPGLRELKHLTNDNVWDLATAPGSLGIIGGGPIGCELAQAMARLGVDVTVIEMADRVLLKEEPEASAVVQAALEADGVRVLTGTTVSRVHAAGSDGGAILAAGEHEIAVDRVLVATGRHPNTADIGLEAAGVEVDAHGHVRVDKRLRTTAQGVFAVGDVNGLLPFTHAANEQGTLVGRAAAGIRMNWTFDPAKVPWATFTSPEVGRVGVTEAEAPPGSRVAYLPMAENDRAIAEGRTAGFVKLIAAPRRLLRHAGAGRIVGATTVAERGGEMIHGPALAMVTNSFVGRLAQLSHAYPTWTFGVQKCAGQFFQPIEGRRARPAVRA